jgi:hypothetical protein
MLTEDQIKAKLMKYYEYYVANKNCPKGSPLAIVLIGHEARIMEMMEILEIDDEQLQQMMMDEMPSDTRKKIHVSLYGDEIEQLAAEDVTIRRGFDNYVVMITKEEYD